MTETVTNGGSNTFAVEAQVGSNTPSAAASDTWTVTTPTPTITSEPANPTNSTSATFKYSDTQAGDTFKCSLDGASYSTCASSGVTYSGLSNATHTFGVEAALGSGPASSAATYSWLVHTTAPSITLTFPAGGSYYNAAGWAAGCSPVGVCGTASDPVGVTSVGVAVLQQSSGKYWNGSSFSSSSQVFNTATGTSSWDYPLARPADGSYTLYVRATDTLGNTTSSSGFTTASFTIDTVAPAAPVISTEEDSNLSTDASPEFEFTDTGRPNVTFSCDLDSGTVMNCTGDTDHDGDTNVEGEWQFENLAPGPHCFYVWATDKAGNVSPTTSLCWTLVGPPASVTEVSGSPQSATVHSAFGSPLVAKVTDALGNPVPGASVTFSAPSSGASGTFSNSSTTITGTTGSNGEVSETFTANTTAGGPYTVTAKVSGVSTVADFSLTNTIGASSKLVFITQPTSGQNVTAGSPSAFKVAVEDAYGNIETSDTTTTVSLSFSASPGSSNLTCTNSGGSGPLTLSGGVASFTCSLNKAGTGYVLAATSANPSLPRATSNSFNVVAASASQLVFTNEPPASTLASSTFSTSVTIEDLYGNKVTSDSSTVTIALYANPCGGTLTGTTSKAASGGVASFSGLQITKACSGYQLSGTDISDGPMLATSSPFAITTAGASKLVFTTEPPASTPSTSTFGVGLTIEDTYGNTVTTDSHTVALSLSTNPCSGTLSGITSKAASSGVASFSGLQITKACTGYKLSATDTSDSLTVTSTAFVITAASANVITVVSGNNQSATQGATFAAPLVVEVTNAGNPVSGASVTFTAPSSGASGTFSNGTDTITATTNASGDLSEAFTTNHTDGSYTVSANTNPTVATPADFSLENYENFSMSWSAPKDFYPNTSQSANLVIDNPNAVAITIPVGGITLSGLTITGTPLASLCAASNFGMTAGPTVTVNIPAGTTESLEAALEAEYSISPASAISELPVITMYDGSGGPASHTNQDDCEGANLTFNFSGTASGS